MWLHRPFNLVGQFVRNLEITKPKFFKLWYTPTSPMQARCKPRAKRIVRVQKRYGNLMWKTPQFIFANSLLQIDQKSVHFQQEIQFWATLPSEERLARDSLWYVMGQKKYGMVSSQSNFQRPYACLSVDHRIIWSKLKRCSPHWLPDLCMSERHYRHIHATTARVYILIYIHTHIHRYLFVL